MKSSTSATLHFISSLGLIMGSIAVFFSPHFAAPIFLASLGVMCIARYPFPSTGFAGSLAIIPAAIIFIYLYGMIDRESPVFNLNLSETVWLIIVLGAIFLITGLLLGGGSSRAEPALRDFNLAGSETFFWAGTGALMIAVVNYVTGDIPLLSGDVNSARFAGNYGILGRLWPVVLPVGQVSVIISLLMLRMRRLEPKWLALGVFSFAYLVLSGGRAFAVIAMIAFGVIYVEIKKPKFTVVLIAAFAGLVAFGLAGQARSLASSNASAYVKFMAKQGLDRWYGSTDLSLQTGPRVLELAIDRLNGEFLGGQIFIGDFGNFVNAAVPRSDRLVTAILGREPGAGGYPPTLFGGLYLDFGWFGVVLGSFLIGLILSLSRRLIYRTPSLSAWVWFSYFGAYIAISVYSYASLRPSWLVVLFLCYAAQISQRGKNGASTARLQVPEVPGRGRASRF